jgi:hypothetical protein
MAADDLADGFIAFNNKGTFFKSSMKGGQVFIPFQRF